MSLRSRLFLGIAATVLVSIVVTVLAGALLTRRSLEHAGIQALERQVDLIAAQRRENPATSTQAELGQFLATDEQRLAILTQAQAELLLPDAGAARLRSGALASGSVDVRGTRFLYAAERNGDEAIVLLRPASRQAADWTPFALGLGLAGLVGAALAAVVALLLSRAVARPVTRVSNASRALAAGEHPEPLRASGPREVAALATSFNDLSAELGRTQEAERAFLLSVSHELKTPLTAIRGHAEALQDGVLEPRGAGTVIDREARRLERLVGDLLDLARLRRRSFSIQAEPLDLGDAAVAAFERHEAVARSFGVGLHAMAEPDAVALGDADRVLQALSNLVENALRSTPGRRDGADPRRAGAAGGLGRRAGDRRGGCAARVRPLLPLRPPAGRASRRYRARTRNRPGARRGDGRLDRGAQRARRGLDVHDPPATSSRDSHTRPGRARHTARVRPGLAVIAAKAAVSRAPFARSPLGPRASDKMSLVGLGGRSGSRRG